ncbi:hypothetical protein ACTXT7_011002 [Hymenolepis weldensis]
MDPDGHVGGNNVDSLRGVRGSAWGERTRRRRSGPVRLQCHWLFCHAWSSLHLHHCFLTGEELELLISVPIVNPTFGSGNKYRMGIELQKALYISSICCVCFWGVFLSIEPLLLAIKINPLIAKGSAIAQSASYLCASILMFSYLYFSKLYKNTWNGYSHAMWYDWGSWLKLGIPGLAMIALKWWYFEIGLILVGVIGVTELAAQTLLININQTLYNLLSVGLGIACSIIVGQSLGAGEAAIPPVTIFAGLFLTCTGMSLAAVLLLALRWHVPKIFTADPKVIAIAAQCMPLLCVFLIFEGAVGVMGGAMRGAGLQPLGALTIFVCLYLLSAPLGFSLLIKSNLKLVGKLQMTAKQKFYSDRDAREF